MYKVSLLALITITVLSLNSCKKDNSTETPQATAVDNSSIFAEGTFDNIGKITTQAMSTGKSMLIGGQTFKSFETTCMTISFDLTSSPLKMIVDFGNTNCLGSDGIYRRGKIIVSYSSGFGDSLATLTTTLDNFYMNDNQITGIRTSTNKGRNQAGHLNWDISVINGSIVLANNAGTISYQATHNNELSEGENTVAFDDNVYLITGSASGTALNGQDFSSVITTPVKAKMDCPHFVSGIVDITPSGELVRTLDFGTGDCDNIATVTVAGITFNIVLPF